LWWWDGGEDGWFTLGKGFGIFLNNPTQSVFFFKRILWCSRHGGDHSENIFSQIWLHARHESRKRIKSFYIYIYIYTYSWLRSGTYHKNLMIWNFFGFKIWQIWVICFVKNLLYIDHWNHIFQGEIWWIYPCSTEFYRAMQPKSWCTREG
jgi:hypothetical protein